jgi:hypothetical protein
MRHLVYALHITLKTNHFILIFLQKILIIFNWFNIKAFRGQILLKIDADLKPVLLFYSSIHPIAIQPFEPATMHSPILKDGCNQLIF